MHKNLPKSRNRAEDNNEPHIGEYPDIQTCHRVRVIFDICYVLYRNPFDDCGAAGSACALLVRCILVRGFG